MAVAAGYDWPGSSSFGQSADQVSPMFPDRPIRPLPKRKLRSRLSIEQAGAISYPPMPASSSPRIGSPQSPNNTTFARRTIEALTQPRDGHDDHVCDCGGERASDLDSEEDEGGARSRSATDGYESFENTNNKKKRKIPVSVPAMVAPLDSILSDEKDVDMVSNGVAHMDGTSSPMSHSSAGSGVGLSGAGRGRYTRQQARPGPERRPLGASSNALNAYANGHTNKMKRDWNSTTTHAEQDDLSDKGIISAAMANAAGRNQKQLPPKGQENVSLLQRKQSASSPGKDFTFECKSDSSNKLGLPHRPTSIPAMPRASHLTDGVGSRGFATQGTQTSPQTSALIAATPSQQSDRLQSHLGQASVPRQGSRRLRRPDQEYAAAARQRQMQQDINNYHHPPRKEDIWICEFCEYEAIWGKPPVALVRQYEIKDRRERKAAEERRRLLEKAKAKGRKNKRSGKGAKNAGATAPTASHGYDPQYDNAGPQEHDSQGEEFFDDDDDGDDYDEGGLAPSRAVQFNDDDVGYEADQYTPTPTARGG